MNAQRQKKYETERSPTLEAAAAAEKKRKKKKKKKKKTPAAPSSVIFPASQSLS